MPILAVFGASRASEDEERVAFTVAEKAVEHGWAVLTGGGAGVMAAANRGAVETGGVSVGVLPVARATEDYPNPWVEIPIFTGAGSARNHFNVLSADLCVAIGGGAGTLSEIALALKSDVEIWCFRSWSLIPPATTTCAAPRKFDSFDDLMDALERRLG